MDSKLGRIEIALEKKIYQKSFYEFYKAAFCQLHPGLEYDENWHAKYICDILQSETERVVAKKPREKDIIINVPPRSSKSMIVTVIWPVWSWTIDPTLKFLTCSYSDTIATILARQSKDLINTNWFQRLYGTKVKLRGDLQGAGHYGNTATGFRYSFGADGTVTGIGGDFLVGDDLQNPKLANSEVERANTIERWNGTISNRLNQLEIGGRILVMQRLHLDDIAGHLLNPKTGIPENINHICIPAEYDENLIKPPELRQYYHDKKYFWKTRFSERVLAAERKKGELYFAGQFQQTPIPLEGNLFKRSWFEIIDPEMISRNETESPIHFFLDTAYTDKDDENDPTGIMACFRKGNDLYILNYAEVYMNFPNLCKFVPQYAVLNGYSSSSGIYIEPKANGMPVVERLAEATSLNVIKIEIEGRMPDKVSKAASMSPIAHAGKIKLVRGPWNDYFLSTLCGFPKAQHDEVIDCLYYGVENQLPINDFLAMFV